jgi:catabolite regulation protein CreA
MSTSELANHLTKHILKSTKTPMQEKGHTHLKHTTHGTDSFSFSHMEPSTHHDAILKDHKNIEVHKSGTSIIFKHKGVAFARHRMKFESQSDPMSSIKGSGELISYKKKGKVDEMMTVGAGVIAGMPTHTPPDQTPVRLTRKPARRKKFAGHTVFVVDESTFHKAYLGKRKYQHYDTCLEGCEYAEEIREYGRKNWDAPIILQSEATGAMIYLKYGKR